MDFTSVLKNELFRPLTTLIVPGAVAVGPYLLILGYYVPAVPTFWNDHPNAFVTIIVIVILAVGLLLDNLGAAVEYYGWDNVLEKKQPGHMFRWREYLKLEVHDELVGQRYLRNTLVRMKFELAMPPAIFSFVAGLIWLNCLYAFWSGVTLIVVAGLLITVAILLVRESYQSAKILADTRTDLLTAKQRPLNPPESGTAV